MRSQLLPTRFEAFRQGLCASSVILKDKNIVVEYRYAEGKLDRSLSLWLN